MRVIAGSARGRVIRCLRGRSIRPTRDRVREAIFSSLAPRLPGSRVLDLFAGTGALGIEALSRGAASAVFVEVSRQACDLIRANLAACGWLPSKDIRIEQADAIRWLREATAAQARSAAEQENQTRETTRAQGPIQAQEPAPAQEQDLTLLHALATPGSGHTGKQAFDIVFADPPYREGWEEAILTALGFGDFLSPDGLAVIESETRRMIPQKAGELSLYKSKTYGDTRISYFTINNETV